MADSKHSQDERGEPRSDVDLSVQWTDGQRVRKGMIKDASVNGLFLSPAWKPTDPITPGDVITMLISGQSDETTEVEAVVRWVGASNQHECQGIGLATVSETDLRHFGVDDKDE